MQESSTYRGKILPESAEERIKLINGLAGKEVILRYRRFRNGSDVYVRGNIAQSSSPKKDGDFDFYFNARQGERVCRRLNVWNIKMLLVGEGLRE